MCFYIWLVTVCFVFSGDGQCAVGDISPYLEKIAIPHHTTIIQTIKPQKPNPANKIIAKANNTRSQRNKRILFSIKKYEKK